MQPVKEYTFDNFIVGKSNQFAFTAAKAVADKPGETYNPLLICGESGLGQTHLLDAIYNQVSAQLPDASISIFTADELIKMMVRTFKAELEKMWYADLLSADILLIDDIHTLVGKRATHMEFVSLLHAFIDRGSQVVMTFSVLPLEMPHSDDTVRNDFNWGLFADIQPLDSETAKSIILNKAERSGLRLAEDACEYIDNNGVREARRIEGIINRLQAQRELMGSFIDLDVVNLICEDSEG